MNRVRKEFFLCRAVSAFVLIALLFAAGTALAASTKESVTKRLAVLPWKVNAAESMGFLSGAVSEMLTSRLGSVDGVSIVRSDILNSTLEEYTAKSGAGAVAAGVGEKLKLDYVLYGSVTILGGSVSLDVKLLDVKSKKLSPFFSSGRGLDSIVSMADKISKEAGYSIFPELAPVKAAAVSVPAPAVPVAAAAQGAPLAASAAAKTVLASASKVRGGEKLWKGPLMDGSYKAFVSADLNKDGVKELFLLKESSITVAVVSDGELKVVKELQSRGDVQFVAIDAIDTNSDGTVEIYVSGVRNRSAESYSIEYGGQGYVWGLSRLRRLFRAVDRDGKRLLVGQSFREADGFYGDLRLYESVGAGLVDKGRFEPHLPREVDLYSFTLLNDKNGNELLAAIGTRGRMAIYNRNGTQAWQYEWKSSEYFGGTLNYIEIGDEETDTQDVVVPIQSRFIFVDADGNGSKELIVKTGTPGGFGRYAEVVRSYKDGTVLALSWDGQFLNELWRTKKVSSYISDFFVEELESGKGVDLWMLITQDRGAMFGSPKSYVLFYRLAL